VTKYIVNRVLISIPVLFGLSVVLFAFIHLLPGDPATAVLGEHATPARIAEMRAYLGLDDPLPVQYGRYIVGLLHGDFGKSLINNKPVLTEYLHRFPATLELTATAMIFAAATGIPLGRIAARHAQAWPDSTVTIFSLVGISIPVFLLGLALQVLFAVNLRLLPASGRLDPRTLLDLRTNFMLIDPWLMPQWTLGQKLTAFIDAIRHLILPAITLGSVPLAIITRITRASVIEVSNEDYVRTARAKGLREWRIENRHIMRNAWLPIVTIIGLQVGSLLGGAVLTETVFAWNGVGNWVVQAISYREYFVIQSTILIFAFIFLLVNLTVDIAYAFLDPRIRYG
jgi:peptide/nickel transport system permease protein